MKRTITDVLTMLLMAIILYAFCYAVWHWLADPPIRTAP